MPVETFGERIRRLRRKKDWSQTELGKLVGNGDPGLAVGKNSVLAWEKDQSTPEAERLDRLAQLFGVTMEYLLHGDEGLYRQAFEEIEGVVNRTRKVARASGQAGAKRAKKTAGEKSPPGAKPQEPTGTD